MNQSDNTKYKVVLLSYDEDNVNEKVQSIDAALYLLNHEADIVTEKIYDATDIGYDDINRAIEFVWAKLEVIKFLQGMNNHEFRKLKQEKTMNSLINELAHVIYGDYESIEQDIEFKIRDHLGLPV